MVAGAVKEQLVRVEAVVSEPAASVIEASTVRSSTRRGKLGLPNGFRETERPRRELVAAMVAAWPRVKVAAKVRPTRTVSCA